MNVGIVGCGRIADLHVAGYLLRDDAVITAVCDRSIEYAAQRAAEWGVDAVAFDNMKTAFRSGLFDTVDILLPHYMLADAAKAALDAGLNVNLQKPMALSVAIADELVAAVAQSSGSLRVYENFLFYPPIVRAIELIRSGAIGDIQAVRLKSNVGFSPTAWNVPASAQEWRNEMAAQGFGPLVFDDGHHKFSLAWALLGYPVKVAAFIGHFPDSQLGPLDAPALISMQFTDQKVASLEIVFSPGLEIESVHYAQDDRLEITGTAGVIFVAHGHGGLADVPALSWHANGKLHIEDVVVGWDASFVGAVQDGCDAWEAGRQPMLSVEQARDVLAISMAAHESAARSEVIVPPPPLAGFDPGLLSNRPEEQEPRR
jgi:predicted dehydrogenase